MNDTLNNSLETNFRGKCNHDLIYSDPSYINGGKCNYNELITLLLSDNIKEKHFAVLELEEIHSNEDAKLLVSNLVEQDGKVREAVAYKINEFFKNSDYAKFFISEEIFDILIEGIMDINGNVCRQIGGKCLENDAFKRYLCGKLPARINEILERIEKLTSTEKQYVISKRNFQLYWCLEALYNVVETIDFDVIKNIILKTGKFYDYTIREKTAKILTKIDNFEVKELKEKLKNDENYYVRRY